MKTKEELINNWIKKAGKDLLTAQHELSFPDAVTESICFHCQQAVEKFLKAYLVFLGIEKFHLKFTLSSNFIEKYLDIGDFFMLQYKHET